MKTLDEMIKTLPPESQARVEAQAKALVEEEMTLRELRKALHLTQADLAEVLGIGQENVSRLESRSDLRLSTLRRYVEAVGGCLQIVAHFPDRPDVSLSPLLDEDERNFRVA